MANRAFERSHNTLFAELRDPMARGATYARRERMGLWPADVTRTGFAVPGEPALHDLPPVWPKLWRRLVEFERDVGGPLSDLVPWLDAKNERIDIIGRTDERGLQDVVVVEGDVVRMTVDPVRVRVRSSVG